MRFTELLRGTVLLLAGSATMLGAVTVIAAQEVPRRRHADPKRRLGGHRFAIGGAADAVGSKERSGHDLPLGVQPVPGSLLGWLIPKPVCHGQG